MAKKKASRKKSKPKSFTFNEDAPLKRNAKGGESAKANKALFEYALMGSQRSLRALLANFKKQKKPAPPTRSWATLTTWSVRNHWQDRILRFDQIEHETDLILWDKRRRQLRQSDWELGGALRDRAQQYLDALHLHVETTKHTEAGRTIVYKALDATLGQIAQVLMLANKLQSLATDRPTEHVRLSDGDLNDLLGRALAKQNALMLTNHDDDPDPG